MSKFPLSEYGMTKSGAVAGGLYFTFMVTSIIITLYFGLIPLDQMGIRRDTLLLGVLTGVVCQIPMFVLTFLNTSRVKKGSKEEETFEKLMRHARMHATYAVVDAPIAETFWSGIVLSSLVTYLTVLGLGPIVAKVVGITIGTGVHIISHTGPLRPLFGEGASLKSVYLVMALNRIAFLVSNNLMAPILGHFLFANYVLAGWRLGNRNRSIALQSATHSPNP